MKRQHLPLVSQLPRTRGAHGPRVDQDKPLVAKRLAEGLLPLRDNEVHLPEDVRRYMLGMLTHDGTFDFKTRKIVKAVRRPDEKSEYPSYDHDKLVVDVYRGDKVYPEVQPDDVVVTRTKREARNLTRHLADSQVLTRLNRVEAVGVAANNVGRWIGASVAAVVIAGYALGVGVLIDKAIHHPPQNSPHTTQQ